MQMPVTECKMLYDMVGESRGVGRRGESQRLHWIGGPMTKAAPVYTHMFDCHSCMGTIMLRDTVANLCDDMLCTQSPRNANSGNTMIMCNQTSCNSPANHAGQGCVQRILAHTTLHYHFTDCLNHLHCDNSPTGSPEASIKT